MEKKGTAGLPSVADSCCLSVHIPDHTVSEDTLALHPTSPKSIEPINLPRAKELCMCPRVLLDTGAPPARGGVAARRAAMPLPFFVGVENMVLLSCAYLVRSIYNLK